MPRLLFRLLLVFAAASPLRAEDTLEQKFRSILAKFTDESWTAREQAEQDLIALGADARDLIQKELEGTKDAEVKMRLRNALAEIGKPRWATGVKAAMEQAARSGRPIFLVCADGPLDQPRSRAGEALRRELASPDLANDLNARFVLVWWNSGVPAAPDDRDPKAEPTAEGDTGPTGCIGIYLCTAKGVVRHFLPGWWSAATIREDLDRMKSVFAAPDAGEASKVRTSLARMLEGAAAKKAADNPEEMAKPASESEIRRDVERQLKVAGAYAVGSEVVGERNVDEFLKLRLKEISLRWNDAQRER